MTRPPHVGRGEEEEGGGGPPASGQSRGVLQPGQSGDRPGEAPLSHDAGGAGGREKPERGGGAGARRLQLHCGRGPSDSQLPSRFSALFVYKCFHVLHSI